MAASWAEQSFTANSDPDWVPMMKHAAAIITEHGDHTSHAAIVSRKLAFPTIVSTGNATRLLHEGQDVTVSCAAGQLLYEGPAEITVEEQHPSATPRTPIQVMLNMANSAAALPWQ